jgi:hypothetical protein
MLCHRPSHLRHFPFRAPLHQHGVNRIQTVCYLLTNNFVSSLSKLSDLSKLSNLLRILTPQTCTLIGTSRLQGVKFVKFVKIVKFVKFGSYSGAAFSHTIPAPNHEFRPPTTPI